MNVVFFFVLGLFFTALIHTIKHRLFAFTYFSGMAIVRDFVWSALLGFIGALLVLKGADTFLWNARQTVTKPFQKSYTFENDFDPNSTEPQYNMVTPGVPWSGVWYDSTLEQNTLVETSTCIYTNQGVEGLPRYYMIEPQDDGSQLIVYYYIEDPTSDSAVATVDMVYQLSADQSTMTRFADPALGTGFDVVYTRPEKSSANSLPEELWGYWASDSLAAIRYEGRIEQWYIIDAFHIDLFSGSSYDTSEFNTGFYNDRIDVKKTEKGTEYHLSMQPLDTEMILTYYIQDGKEKIDIQYPGSEFVTDTLIRLPDEKFEAIASKMQSRNASPRVARPSMIQDRINMRKMMNLETDPNLEQFYAAATEQASETSDEEGVSVFDILNEPLPPLSRTMPENSVPDTAVQPSPEKDASNSLVASTEVTVEDPLSLLGLPGACAITVNGQSVPAALYIDSSCAIEQSVITQENTVIRYIYQDSNGYRSGSAVVNPGATDTFFTGTAISDETGKGQVSSEELTMLMTAYYQKYLQAINEQDTSVMCMITDDYRDAIVSRVTSEANKKNSYDPNQFQIEITDGAIQYSSDFWENDATTIRFNMKVDFVKQDRETQETESMSNYQTVLMRWEDGMWKVANSDFITQDEYNGNVFANFNA